MSIIVFSGPSIQKTDILEILPNAIILPPAKQGDIYLATKENPQIIALIDGLFEQIPAVWHKEILYALSLGIHVYGSSSMGALRAAELDSLGMVGIGSIYSRYASGELEDDDEVALIHAPASLDFQAISRAMVDLRYDIKTATQANLLEPDEAIWLLKQLKSLWYPDRTLQQLFALAKQRLSESRYTDLLEFLGPSPDSLKRKEAIQLLYKLANLNLSHLPPKVSPKAFVENDAWQTLVSDTNKPSPVSEPFSLLPLPHHPTLRQALLDHAQQLKLDEQPWLTKAFENMAHHWRCIDEEGNIQYERISRIIHTSPFSVAEFDQWIAREALLLAYQHHQKSFPATAPQDAYFLSLKHEDFPK